VLFLILFITLFVSNFIKLFEIITIDQRWGR
jgi:hypothetical protein